MAEEAIPLNFIEVLPKPDNSPEPLKLHVNGMLDILAAAIERAPLNNFGDTLIFLVPDTNGEIRFMFKQSERESAINEVIAFLLDHPQDNHRSVSQQIYGFAHVLPTIYVHVIARKVVYRGVLVEYKPLSTLTDYFCASNPNESIERESVLKTTILDMRLVNVDRTPDNLLVKPEENGQPKLIPIDHEHIFGGTDHPYSILGPYWLKWLYHSDYSDVRYSQVAVEYINRLDPIVDIAFCETCGLDLDSSSKNVLQTLYTFLKIAVGKQLSVHHIALCATSLCDREYTVEGMVEIATRDEMLVEAVMEIQLERYKQAVEGSH